METYRVQTIASRARTSGLFAAVALTAGLGILTIAWLPQTVSNIFSTQFLPHVYCYLYDRKLIALHVGSDAAIWLSYIAISVTLTYLVYRTRREVPFSWMFLAFGTFIIACGFTHFMEVTVLWRPLYWLAGDVKLLTAVASVITAVALPPLVPKVHEMISAAKLSDRRQQEIENANLELSRTNQSLSGEVAKRTAVETELRRLSGRLLELQDEERRRLARELHDSTGQLLAAIQLNLSRATQEAGSAQPEMQRRLTDTVELTNQAITEVRTMSYLLHPPMLDEAGLALALQWYVEGFVERSNLQINLKLPMKLDRLSRDLELTIFRVLQESLTNIHRHSGSPNADIALDFEGKELLLSVRDYGKGIALENLEGARGLGKVGVGIRGMQERVRQLGGTLSVRREDSGTLLEARFPVQAKTADGIKAAEGSASTN